MSKEDFRHHLRESASRVAQLQLQLVELRRESYQQQADLQAALTELQRDSRARESLLDAALTAEQSKVSEILAALEDLTQLPYDHVPDGKPIRVQAATLDDSSVRLSNAPVQTARLKSHIDDSRARDHVQLEAIPIDGSGADSERCSGTPVPSGDAGSLGPVRCGRLVMRPVMRRSVVLRRSATLSRKAGLGSFALEHEVHDDDIIPETVTLNNSMWDVTLLIGTQTVGAWASVILTVLLLINCVMVSCAHSCGSVCGVSAYRTGGTKHACLLHPTCGCAHTVCVLWCPATTNSI